MVYLLHFCSACVAPLNNLNNCFTFFRMYTLRKVRHEFKENKTLQDEEKIKQCYAKGEEALSLIKRQVTLNKLYGARPLVIES